MTELEQCSWACVAAAVPAIWVDQLLLQSVLMVGWPRALTATATWRTIGPARAVAEADGAAPDRTLEWQARGEAVCNKVYGANYQRLGNHVAALHPALESWMVTEGYGCTMGRPGLDLARRELWVVAQVAVRGAERPMLGRQEAELARSLWSRIRT